MKNSVLKSIINNKFLPNYNIIRDYFQENNLVYGMDFLKDIIKEIDGECKVEGGFTLNFCPKDTKELFEQNLQTQPENWYYRTHPAKYTLNSLGYRTKEFDDIDWKESIVIFGCSYVFGIGVTDEHSVSYFLEQLSGRPVINMGLGASSIQTVLHNSIILNDSEYPTPKAVVHMITGLNRYQLYETNFIDHIGDWNSSDNQFEKKENLLSFNLMNIKMIRNLWKNKTIYYESTLFSEDKLINKLDEKICCEFFEGDGGLARDLGHNGPVKNLEIARGIYKKIKPLMCK